MFRLGAVDGCGKDRGTILGKRASEGLDSEPINLSSPSPVSLQHIVTTGAQI